MTKGKYNVGDRLTFKESFLEKFDLLEEGNKGVITTAYHSSFFGRRYRISHISPLGIELPLFHCTGSYLERITESIEAPDSESSARV